MPVSTVATFVRGADPSVLARETAAQLRGAAQPVRAGVLFLSGGAPAALASALAAALPGVELLGATVPEAEPGLRGLWLCGDVRAVVVPLAAGAAGQVLAEAAVARAGFRAHQVRLALLHAPSGGSLQAGVFEVLPKGAAFISADVAGVWTGSGPAEAALLVADWQARLAVGFEGAAAALERKGLAPESVVGMLHLSLDAAQAVPAALGKVPQLSARVSSLAGVVDRSPPSPATATLLLTNAKERAEG